MKKLVLVLAGVLLATNLYADEKVTSDINSDGQVFRVTDDSPYAQLCLAVLESREALHEKAKELKIRRRSLNKVDCNGLSLAEFARAHEATMHDVSNIATVQ